MKEQLNDIKAAILFLKFFQIQEKLENNEDLNQETLDSKVHIFQTLSRQGYIQKGIHFDTEGIPQNIPWQNPNFDCKAVYEHIGYNPNWFHPDNR